MKKETKEKLAAIIDRYAKDRQEKEATAQKRQRETEEFEAQATKLENEATIPLIHEFGGDLIKHGHKYEIGKTNAGLAFRIFPSDTSQSHEMLFRTDSSQKRVLIEINPRPYEGKTYVAEVPVKQMTAERVEDEILKFVSGALRKSKPPL